MLAFVAPRAQTFLHDFYMRPLLNVLRLWTLLAFLVSGTSVLRAADRAVEWATMQTLVQERLAKKDVPGLLQLVWWRGADEEAKKSLETAFSELVKYPTSKVLVGEPGMNDQLLGADDSSVRTDLTVKAQLTIDLKVGAAADDVFTFEYPVGQADGRWWILPVLERKRK